MTLPAVSYLPGSSAAPACIHMLVLLSCGCTQCCSTALAMHSHRTCTYKHATSQCVAKLNANGGSVFSVVLSDTGDVFAGFQAVMYRHCHVGGVCI